MIGNQLPSVTNHQQERHPQLEGVRGSTVGSTVHCGHHWPWGSVLERQVPIMSDFEKQQCSVIPVALKISGA